MTSAEMAARANVFSIEAKQAKAAVRRGLATGELRACDVFLDPPACLSTTPMFDVLKMVRPSSPLRLMRLGRGAVDDGVNLAVPLGLATAKARAWVAGRLT